MTSLNGTNGNPARLCTACTDSIDRWNFDLGGVLFPEKGIRVVDCGDVPGSLEDPHSHFRAA